MNARPPIPEDLKRRVRQHCGFGCAICGDMPTDIEHIVPFAVTKSHSFDNLVLLCTRHHREVTAGRMAKGTVADARRSPYARRATSSYAPLLGRQWKLWMGGFAVTSLDATSIVPFFLDGVAPLKITFGNPVRFSMNLESPSGGRALVVTENVFEFHPEKIWDVALTGKKIVVSFGQRSTLLRATNDRGEIKIEEIRLVAGRTPILASPNVLCLVKRRQSFSNVTFQATGEEAFCFDPQLRANVIVSDDHTRPASMYVLKGSCDTPAEAWRMLRRASVPTQA